MRLNKGKKGELLVETIVAMSIAAIMTIAVFGVFKTFSSIESKESEYINFEAVCLNVDRYYDAFGKDMWANKCFKTLNGESRTNFDGKDTYYIEYEDSFTLLKEPLNPNVGVGYTYIVTYDYDNEDNLILSVKNIESNRNIFDSLNYGKSDANTNGDYYKKVLKNNILYEVKLKEEKEKENE